MNPLTQQLKAFAPLLTHDPMPKKDFIKMAHSASSSSQQYLVNFIGMIQFSKVYLKGDDVVLE